MHIPRGLLLLSAWLALLGSFAVRADAGPQSAAVAPIPLAELGARAERQNPTSPPVLALGLARLEAPLQDLAGRVGPDGLTVSSTSDTEGGGDFALRPVALDKGAARAAIPPGTVTTDGRTAVLDRGVLREVFTASADGLRQDFVVAAPPPGRGPLSLTLRLDGATARTEGERIALTLPGGRGLLYDRLRVTDADGRELGGHMTATDAHTLTIAVADAGARYPLTIDPTIADADWTAFNGSLPGTSGDVYAIATTGSGVYFAGKFIRVGAVAANNIAYWNGSVWTALGDGTGGGNPDVTALAWDAGSGRLYVGGPFTTAGGATANHLAVWTGSAWSAVITGANNGVGGVASSSVNALLVEGTTLYVGGNFTSAGGTGANHIAQCACADLANATWSALPAGAPNGFEKSVQALAKAGDRLYATGSFTQAQGIISVSHIAQIDLGAGTPVWAPLGAGLNEAASALALDGSQNLYATGLFTQAGNTTLGDVSGANYIAKWAPGTSTWSALGAGLDASASALAYRSSDDSLYVGGTFTTAGGVAASRLARWDVGAGAGAGGAHGLRLCGIASRHLPPGTGLAGLAAGGGPGRGDPSGLGGRGAACSQPQASPDSQQPASSVSGPGDFHGPAQPALALGIGPASRDAGGRDPGLAGAAGGARWVWRRGCPAGRPAGDADPVRHAAAGRSQAESGGPGGGRPFLVAAGASSHPSLAGCLAGHTETGPPAPQAAKPHVRSSLVSRRAMANSLSLVIAPQGCCPNPARAVKVPVISAPKVVMSLPGFSGIQAFCRYAHQVTAHQAGCQAERRHAQ